MGVRFNAGQSVHTTKTTRNFGAAPSRAPDGNTMKGLRGFIKTGQDVSDGGLRDSRGVGPKREGPIGTRAKPGDAHYTGKYADNGKFRGSSDKSYRATSTGPAGKVVSNKGTPQSRGKSESEGPSRGAPRAGKPMQGKGGFNGKMESLRGRALTSYEKRK